MVRAVLTPRWLALHVLLVAVVVAFCGLGNWQLDRARAEAKPKSDVDKPPIALADLMGPTAGVPGDEVGRRMTASGEYDGAHQLLVADRVQHGRPGYWLLTPLRTTTGPAVMVVRGWVAEPADPAGEPATGRVTVTGRLQPSEPLGEPTTGLGGEITSITTTELIQRLPYDIYDGYIVLTQQTPPADLGPEPVDAPLRAAPRGSFPLQNTAYAIQWWLFAVFAVALWWRLARDAVHATTNGVAAPRPSGEPPNVHPAGQPTDPDPAGDRVAAGTVETADVDRAKEVRGS